MVKLRTKAQRLAVVQHLDKGGSSRTAALPRGVSKTTIRRVARRSGMKYLAYTRSCPLTDAHRAARLAFAKRHRKTDWTRVSLPPPVGLAGQRYPSPKGKDYSLFLLVRWQFLGFILVYCIQVVFSDETAVRIGARKRMGWCKDGARKVRVVSGYAAGYQVWAACGVCCHTPLVRYQTMNANVYINCIDKHLLPQLRRRRRCGLIFQQV